VTDAAAESDEPIPAARLPLSVRAPGKCILFGEHAVVYGRPEILLAIDLYTQVGMAAGPVSRLNGDADGFRAHPYVRAAFARLWPEASPVDLTVVSRVPKSAGLGSSGALVAALAAGFGAATGGVPRAALAESSFAVERAAQGGVGSPGDTSASVAGGCLAINASDRGRLLWEISDGDRRWRARRVPDPGWVWIVAYSGVPRDTATTVRAVADRVQQPDGPAQLEELARLALEGLDGLIAEDRQAVGGRMDRAHDCLARLGVSHPRLEALRAAVRESAEGSKLTGAGAGGSVVALPKPGREAETMRRLARAGAVAYAVRTSARGVSLVEAPRADPGPNGDSAERMGAR
jgi:mevalonate kinase